MIKEEELKDPFAWTGDWWLPSRPQTKLPGTLCPMAVGGPELRVMGTYESEGAAEHKPIEIIHGTTPAAEFVTLHLCNEAGNSYDARGQFRTSYLVELVVTGEHFLSTDSIAFQNLQIEYSNLTHWACMPVVDDSECRGGVMFERKVRINPPVIARLHSGEGYVLTLCYGATMESTGPGISISIFPGADVELSWDAPRQLASTLPVIESFRDFLTFATGQSTHVAKVKAEPVRVTSFGHAHEMLLFHRSHAGPKAEQELNLPLFTFEDVAPFVERVVGAWFQKGKVLQPVIDLHLAPVYSPQMQLESQFLTAIQALEAFHRRMRDAREIPEEEHKVRVAKIIVASPEEHRKWLEDELRYSNEPRLRKRIKSLFGEFEDILKHFELERKPFADLATNTRNYLTHYDPQLKDKAAVGRELWQLVHATQLLVDTCLLHECGVEHAKIPELLKRRHMTLVKR